jgi:polyhydroxyalkanoate synthesis regulator protein
MSEALEPKSILVKRYAGSRLYDTENQRYVSIEQLKGWVADGVVFTVLDIETGVDVTDVLLA